MLQRLDRVHDQQSASWLLDYYFDGWAEADAAMILDATAPNYHFHDPLVGLFSRQSFPEYFELLQAHFARAGTIERRDLAFRLHGPMNGPATKLMFWREAPRLGLTGVAQIIVGPYGVVAERVAYDLNLASDLLTAPERRPRD